MCLVQEEGLRILSLCGTPEAMGQEQGKLLKRQIGLVVEGFLRESGSVFEVPYPFLLQHAQTCLTSVPARYVEEMRALAEASDVSFEEILALNCLSDIDAVFMKQLHQCCNFVAGPPFTVEDLLLHGRNLDFPPAGETAPNAAVVIYRAADGAREHSTLSITWAGFVGTYTGANSALLSIGEIGSPSVDATANGVPISFLIRGALENSRSCDQVVQHFQSASRTAGYNLAVADGKAKTAVGIEFTASHFGVRRMRQGRLIVDNPCLCPETARERLTYPAGAFRHARMMQLFDMHRGEIDVPVAMSMLKDRMDLGAGVARGNSYNCLCNRHTVQSVLFLPSEGRLFVSQGSIPAPRGKYVEIPFPPYRSEQGDCS